MLTLTANGSIDGLTAGLNLTNTGTVVGGGFSLTLNGAGSLASKLDTSLSGLFKAMAGTWTMSGDNTYSGGTTLNAGTLKAGSATAWGTGVISVSSTGASLDLNGWSMNRAGILYLNGTGVSSSGALMNSGSAATYTGPITLLGASSIVGGAGAITLSNAISGSNLGLTLGGGAGGTVVSAIGTGAGSLTKQDSGTWSLNGNNTYTGTTTISGGVLKLGHAGALGSGLSGGVTITSGALDLNGQTIAVAKPLTLNGYGVDIGGGMFSGALLNSSSTAASYAGLVTLGSASSIIGGSGTIALTSTSGTGITGSFSLTLGGAAGGSIATPIYIGTGSMTKQDAGSWILNGLSAFSGGVSVNGGTLTAGATNNTAQFSAFGGGSNPITVNGGTLALGTYSQNAAAVTVGSDGGSITSSTGVLSASSITFNNTAAASASAILYTTNGLTKNGSGTTTLSGANAYTGGTFINAGTLQIASDANLGTVPNTAATNITINGGTLQGTNAAALVNLHANRLIS
ncbi:MAG: hypothetical protein EB125_09665, partial [Betaproteobacteria bacterium]|nr:hypothetical protein [Betaproteobacteria bacterium]